MVAIIVYAGISTVVQLFLLAHVLRLITRIHTVEGHYEYYRYLVSNLILIQSGRPVKEQAKQVVEAERRIAQKVYGE